MTGRDVETQAVPMIEQMLRAIPAVSDLRISYQRRVDNAGPDILAEVEIEGPSKGSRTVPYALFFEVKSNGQPRWARIAAVQLTRYVQQAHARGVPRAYGILVAPYVSETSAAILQGHGHGYFDLAGNGQLALRGIYVERKGHSNPFSERSELRSLFAPKASRVLRVLLRHPYKPWRMTALAKEADVSYGLVAKAKPLLLDREWVQVTARGLALVKPDDALDCWATTFRRRRNQIHNYYSLENRQEAERRLAEAAETLGARYALAGCSGAERFAPHVSYHRATAYVNSQQTKQVARHAGFREVSRGANVQIFDAYDDGVFHGKEKVGGIWIANPVQLFIDLKQTRAREDESAAFLHSQIIKPLWETALNRERTP
ncbi:MAG: hypothetical protein F4246_05465 [Rhodothermaceae bacterium]|nr:hypothetical protein [Rhodothermaceae bacterium]MYD20095.1 hypothetical protein [Rhodothermaceae bacterium]MYD56445.1 hypothetical protein [Rhodothermaceae bacterium]MYI42896.1 hypothetical protein [Rhodothermaceae bacterium]MYJ56102.1 hypothetical protein [Rhodothermaceae bacterium]